MSKESSYPSPEAAQASGGAGPYPGRSTAEADPGESLLRAQLENEIDRSQQTVNHGPGSFGQGQQEQNYAPQLNYGYPHMGGMDGQGTPSHPSQHHHAIVNNATPSKDGSAEDQAKKKSKVTRACDECRRKKIKCDADAETSGNVAKCSNCNRTNSDCLFSKPAQKRGPSRGYIRDLSDRVADLEQQKRAREGSGSGDFSPLLTAQKQSSPFVHLGMTGAKRSFSMSEGAPNGMGGYAQNVAPQASMLGAGSQASHTEFTPEEKEAIERYMSSAYRWLFPIAFADVDEVQYLMGACPQSIRQGFFMALRAILLLESDDRNASFTVYKHLIDIAVDPASLPNLANLVYLQSITLALYVLSYSGHPASQPTYAASTATLYGTASGIISHLNIHKMNVTNAAESTQNSVIYTVGRRALWAIVVIAQWDAIGMGRLRQILKDDLTLTQGDRSVLGSIWHALASFTVPLNGIHASLLKIDATDSEIKTNAVRFAEQVQLINSTIDPLPEMAFANAMSLTLTMLIARYRAAGAATIPDRDAVVTAITAIDMLANPQSGDFPLSHHAAALAAKTCVEAVGFKAVREEGRAGLEKLLAAMNDGTALRHNGWKDPIAKQCKEKLDSLGGLQHLANAAVGAAKGEAQVETGLNVTSVVKEGYLKVLVG